MNGNNPSTNGNATATAEKPQDNSRGRDGKGRFTSGNKGGPGNPFAAAVAKLRMAALKVVTPDQLEGVFRVLLLRAQTGHFPSIKLLLAYTIGLPVPTVDPDEVLDAQEEPTPPPVIEEDPEEEELQEEESEEDEEPPVEPQEPLPASATVFPRSLSDVLGRMPSEVLDEIASRLRAATAPQAGAEPRTRERPTEQRRAGRGEERMPPPDPPRRSDRAAEPRVDGGQRESIQPDPYFPDESGQEPHETP